MDKNAYTPDGLYVNLDRIVYLYEPENTPPGRPHLFIYFISIHNESQEQVILLGRKWVITYPNGSREIVEGNGIVGQTPRIHPGDSFNYNSYHVSSGPCKATGGYFGVDSESNRISVLIPEMRMNIPD